MIDVAGKQTIAVISTVHETYDTRIFYKQIASLRASYEIVYFSPASGAPEYDWIVPLPKSRSKLGRLRTQLALIRKLRHCSADLYLLHDPELLPLGIVLKCLGKKVVWDMHEDTYNDIKTKSYLKPITRSIVALIYKLFQSISYRLFDGFILAEDGYGCYFGHGARFCVVHNYPLLERLSRYQEVAKNPGTIVYIGSIAANRGIFQLLDLVARLQPDFPSITLQLIGPFSDERLEASVRRHIRERNIDGNVQVRGPMKNIDAYGELAKCMVGLALLLPEPNFTKSLPTKMFEYMALGLPVVVSNFPLWESIVKNHNAGAAVDPFDTGSASEAVRRLLSDQDLYASLSRNARQAAQQYSWETENMILQNFLGNILAKH
jgi:glycosyltransferase involved in cell wall biosynthesis